jgi:hydroxymethylpyrimidine/phosphomethylpyrimidine kinase
MTRRARIPVCLSIAGSDSGGGAGIQADLKAFARCGVHGTTAITALTAQNTVAVTRVLPVPGDMVVAQIEAVVGDLGIDAVKIGMVGAAPVIEAVAAALDALPAGTPVVLDPVMVAESGGRLLEADAEQALVELLLPRATVVTPNVPEARVLAGAGAAALDGAPLARAVQAAGARAVVVTGGHRAQATDVLLTEAGDVIEIPGKRHATAPRTGRAARTPRRSPPTSRSASRCTRRHVPRARSRPTRSASACASSAPAPARSTCSAWGAATSTRSCRRAGWASRAPWPEARGRLDGRRDRQRDHDGDGRHSGRVSWWRSAQGPGAAEGHKDRRQNRRRGMTGPRRGVRRVIGAARGHPFVIIRLVRLLRMKPGHGEVLLAEGDVGLPEDEQRLIAEFRRQLDEGMWAAVPMTSVGGRREARMVKAFEDVPRDADRVIFFPRAAGGR